jgi:thioesterase domain-containing protein/acyl carrier protein
MSTRTENTAVPVSAESTQADVVAGLFAELFDLDQVATDDDFFRLGGDSLLAEQLILEIEQRFGVALSTSVLIETPNPFSLAKVINTASRRAASPLFVAGEYGPGAPLYCVHGMGGASLFPHQIAEALAGTNPVYGFRAIGLEADERPLTTVEAMANGYISAIEAEMPLPDACLMLGHCGGAMVAYEMARILISRGKSVALVMIDPEADGRAPFLHKSSLLLALRLKYLRLAYRARRMERRIGAAANTTGDERRKMVEDAMNVAVARYRPKPLGCPTLFIHTLERRAALLDPGRGYPALLGDCRFVELHCDHARMFRDHLQEIAEAIRQFLESPQR